MDHHGKTKVVSGYATLKAAQRAAELSRIRKPSGSSPPEENSLTKPSSEPRIGSHIGHTVMPTKLEVVCYGCGYSFKMTGRAASTHCPKCRAMVDLSDHHIDTPWTGSVRTGGKIEIAREGVILAGELIAGDIQLNGEVKGGRLQAIRELQLGPGARFDADRIKAPDLKVLPGAEIRFSGNVEFRKVVIQGSLTASLRVSERMVVEPGGLFSGALEAEHLEVLDGGGLKGSMKIGYPPDVESTTSAILRKRA